MSKKEYILKVLDALIGIWPLARGLRILVDGNALDEKTIDNLIGLLSKTIATIQENDESKIKLQKSKDAIEKIKQIEREQHNQDTKTLEDLDIMIKEI